MVNSENEDEGAALWAKVWEITKNNPKLEPVFINNKFIKVL
jgi:hypothetical protein